jgi:hypothetical protein
VSLKRWSFTSLFPTGDRLPPDQFLTILKRQRNHAEERCQDERSHLFDGLIDGVAGTPSGFLRPEVIRQPSVDESGASM